MDSIAFNGVKLNPVVWLQICFQWRASQPWSATSGDNNETAVFTIEPGKHRNPNVAVTLATPAGQCLPCCCHHGVLPARKLTAWLLTFMAVLTPSLPLILCPGMSIWGGAKWEQVYVLVALSGYGGGGGGGIVGLIVGWCGFRANQFMSISIKPFWHHRRMLQMFNRLKSKQKTEIYLWGSWRGYFIQ